MRRDPRLKAKPRGPEIAPLLHLLELPSGKDLGIRGRDLHRCGVPQGELSMESPMQQMEGTRAELGCGCGVGLACLLQKSRPLNFDRGCLGPLCGVVQFV